MLAKFILAIIPNYLVGALKCEDGSISGVIFVLNL